MSKREDVLIIGGGVIGVCTAYYLAERGCPVTLVEKDDIGAGCSYGNAGLIVPSHAIPLAAPGALTQGLKWLLDPDSPFYIKPRFDLELFRWLFRFRAACKEEPMRRAIPVLLALGRASAELFQGLAASNDLEFGYEQKGWLLLFNSRRGFEQGIEEAHLLQEFGVISQVLDAAGVRQMEPEVMPSVIGGIYYPEDAHLVPDRFVRELARLAESRGVCLKPATEVLGFETSGRQISAVITTRGNFRTDQAVLATGAWSPDVARELRLRLPIQAAKGYSITVKAPPTRPHVPLFLSESRVAVTPMGETLRFGGTLELAGPDLSINRQRVAAISQAVREYLNGMAELELIEIWRGLRSVTPDGLPIIGRSKSLENLIVASGHGTLGISLGPITGKLVSQIISGEAPAIDLTPLRAERFS
ncbi:MAG: FAD-dependent oxidoreductase [Chloroflexota bacterium]